jgi:adenylate cyclase
VPSVATAEQGHPVIRWLMTEARRRSDPNDFLEALAQQLREAGVDVARITTGVPILHPQIFSFSGLWEIGKGVTERLFRSGPDISATMLNSPIRIAYEGGGPVRCDLTLAPREGEFAILVRSAPRWFDRLHRARGAVCRRQPQGSVVRRRDGRRLQ